MGKKSGAGKNTEKAKPAVTNHPDRGPQQTDPSEEQLKVQVVIQNENRIFTSVSNVLKSDNNTAKNSIGNI